MGHVLNGQEDEGDDRSGRGGDGESDSDSDREGESDRKGDRRSLHCANVNRKEFNEEEEENGCSTGFMKGSKFYVA